MHCQLKYEASHTLAWRRIQRMPPRKAQSHSFELTIRPRHKTLSRILPRGFSSPTDRPAIPGRLVIISRLPRIARVLSNEFQLPPMWTCLGIAEIPNWIGSSVSRLLYLSTTWIPVRKTTHRWTRVVTFTENSHFLFVLRDLLRVRFSEFQVGLLSAKTLVNRSRRRSQTLITSH